MPPVSTLMLQGFPLHSSKKAKPGLCALCWHISLLLAGRAALLGREQQGAAAPVCQSLMEDVFLS